MNPFPLGWSWKFKWITDMIFKEFLTRDLALIQLGCPCFSWTKKHPAYPGLVFWERVDLELKCSGLRCENSGLNLWKVGGDHELFDLDTIKSLQKPTFSCIFNGLYMTHILGGLKSSFFHGFCWLPKVFYFGNIIHVWSEEVWLTSDLPTVTAHISTSPHPHHVASIDSK